MEASIMCSPTNTVIPPHLEDQEKDDPMQKLDLWRSNLNLTPILCFTMLKDNECIGN